MSLDENEDTDDTSMVRQVVIIYPIKILITVRLKMSLVTLSFPNYCYCADALL